MSERTAVTAIIIFFNAERFIDEAIESVFAQTFTDWELLLVDDGSIDRSSSIAKRWTATCPERVRYLKHHDNRNHGMSASRNLGLRHARGNFIAFLDADDVWLPRKLEQQVSVMNAYPDTGMVYGRTIVWHSWTGASEHVSLDHVFDLGVPPDTLMHPPDLLSVLLRNEAQTPTTCNALIRKRVFDGIGGFEEKFRGMYEDQVFFAKVELSESVYVSGEYWAKYRQHPGSCSAKASAADDAAARKAFLDSLRFYMLQHQIPSHFPVWRTLKREIWRAKHPTMHKILAASKRAYRGLIGSRKQNA